MKCIAKTKFFINIIQANNRATVLVNLHERSNTEYSLWIIFTFKLYSKYLILNKDICVNKLSSGLIIARAANNKFSVYDFKILNIFEKIRIFIFFADNLS